MIVKYKKVSFFCVIVYIKIYNNSQIKSAFLCSKIKKPLQLKRFPQCTMCAYMQNMTFEWC